MSMLDGQARRYTAMLGDKEVIIETGKLAGLADGAVTVRMGDSIILATAVASAEPREGIGFFPLTVDFEERLYAAGRIPGSYFRREGRPTETAILLSRLVDRALRPLFPDGYRNDVQVIITALSSDGEHPLDTLAAIGTSAALTISSIPFLGPVANVHIGLSAEGEFLVNPTRSELATSRMDLRVSGTQDSINMVECAANEVDEETMLAALQRAHEAIQPLIQLQQQMREEVGKPTAEYTVFRVPEEVETELKGWLSGKVEQVIRSTKMKEERAAALNALREEYTAAFTDESGAPRFAMSDIKEVFEDVVTHTVRELILSEGQRPDGRRPEEIRAIRAEVGISPRAHGSGLFTRGETQVLSIATLGTIGEEQNLDDLGPAETKRYIHHYNFPPFSTGEAYPLRGPRRREIGHGALAEAALRAMIPSEDDFPYTIRVVSEVLSSNGSTSMASVCASTLALMDAGVPIHSPVAGIAMGLITHEESGRYQVLTDIQGMEDHLGDMDFKVAGTEQGITALQMDIKIKGLNPDIFRRALSQAREARLFILEKMLDVISEPREDMSPYAPRIITVHIEPSKIGKLIGPGGKTIRSIQEETGVKIDVEDSGAVYIASTDGASAARAREMVEALTAEAEIGRIYTGRVVRIEPFGAFVEILPGVDGLVHISQLADYRVASVEDVVKVGDEIMVMVTDIDSQGKIRLSRQAVLEGWTAEEAREADRGGRRGAGGSPRGGDRDRGRGGRGRDRR